VSTDCPGDIEMTFDSYPSKNLTLENMHKILLDDFDGSPFCYFGVADFTYFEGTAILKAAIYGEDITNTTGYFPESPYQLENQLAFIGGCVGKLTIVVSNIVNVNIIYTLNNCCYNISSSS